MKKLINYFALMLFVVIVIHLCACGQSFKVVTQPAGSNGSNALFKLTNVTGLASSVCASGSGIKLDSGLDLNSNGVLDSSEITATQYVCNGQTGVQGPIGSTGPAGVTTPAVPTDNDNLGYQSGLSCSVYKILNSDENANFATMLSNATLKFSLIINQMDVGNMSDLSGFPKFTSSQTQLVGTADYAIDCSGFLNVPESGLYTFNMYSDDGSQLIVNNNILVNMDQLQSATNGTSKPVMLYKGMNPIDVLYFQGPHTNIALTMQWQGPQSAGLSKMQTVSSSYFFSQVTK